MSADIVEGAEVAVFTSDDEEAEVREGEGAIVAGFLEERRVADVQPLHLVGVISVYCLQGGGIPKSMLTVLLKIARFSSAKRVGDVHQSVGKSGSLLTLGPDSSKTAASFALVMLLRRPLRLARAIPFLEMCSSHPGRR